MRIVLCEDWYYPIYGEVFRLRFEELGAQVLPLKTRDFFPDLGSPLTWNVRTWSQYLQRRWRIGPCVARLNAALLAAARDVQAEMVFLYRCDLIWPKTLRRLRELGVRVLGYNNDDPFSPRHSWYKWRLLKRGIRYHDIFFAARDKNLAEYTAAGCSNSELLRFNYVRELHYPLSELSAPSHMCDVSFAGHWEDDGREEHLLAITQDPAIRLRLYGTDWHRCRHYALLNRVAGLIRPAYGPEYNLVLNSSRIVLSFHSRMNNDTSTSRSFEIPASGAFMLSQYSDDLNSLFQEGVEAEYFRCKEEMLDKIRFYLANDDARKRIAAAGRARLLRDGHEALDRVRQILAAYERLKRRHA
ncbi:MAG TPA: glycosyltransferase [Planctomycetota bacterium]